jgi:hypothetical protein
MEGLEDGVTRPRQVRGWRSPDRGLRIKLSACPICSKTAPIRTASKQAVENRILAIARNEHHGRQSLYFQSMVRLTSRTSRVRAPSPAP